MQGKNTLLVLGLLSIVFAQTRLDYNSDQCNNYTKKFGTANAANGVGATSLAYTGDAAFVTGTANLQVNLRYSDSLYNDATYFGLVQEDGKTAAQTCLDLKLYKFSNSSYSDAQQVTDLTFTATSNFNKKWRYLSFTIPGDQLATRMVQTTNSNNYVYTGYYAVAYYLAGTTQVQYTYYFQFSATVTRSSNAAVSTAFKPLSQIETVGCTTGASCTQTASTVLKYCTDATCKVNTVPDLYLNDQFLLLQVVNTTGMTNFYLTNTTVYYTGSGLNKKATINAIDNSVKGQVLLTLAVDIAWSNVTIQVTSYISTTQTGARRLLATEDTVTYDPVSGYTQPITCIKATKDAATCATCEQECAAQGYARDTCDACTNYSSSSILAFALLALLLLFAF